MKNLIPLFAILFLFNACGDNAEEKESSDNSAIIPAVPFIKSQLAMIDTSLFAIRKIESTDTLSPDTLDVHRNMVRELAKEFTSLPDLSLKEYSDKYKQSKNYYEDLNRISFVTLPAKEAEAGIQKQEVIIIPDSEGGKMNKIIIDQEWVTRDSSIKKNLIWQVDEYFQITTLRQLPGQPEKIHVLKVTWQDFTK